MKRIVFLLFFIVLNSATAIEQFKYIIEFGANWAGIDSKDTIKTVKIYNKYNCDLTVRDIVIPRIKQNDIFCYLGTDTVYKIVSISKTVIAPNDSFEVAIRYRGIHNLNHLHMAFIKVDVCGNQFSIPIWMQGFSSVAGTWFSTSMYRYTSGLRKFIKEKLELDTSLNYKEARMAMFSYTDNYDGYVECIYTGRKIQTDVMPDVTVTHFNTEHTWPQSFGASEDPERSNIQHMRPSDENANSVRANYRYGNVVSDITWEQGGSKLGKDETGEIVFEVRDKYKGDVARGIAYFAMRYGNKSFFLEDRRQEDVLREWNRIDPPDSNEMRRNNRIEFYQKVRNPFIDHSFLLDRVCYFTGGTSDLNYYFKSDDTLVINNSEFGSDTAIVIPLTIFNFGETILLWEPYEIDSKQIEVIDSLVQIPAGAYLSVGLRVRKPFLSEKAILRFKFIGYESDSVLIFLNSGTDIADNKKGIAGPAIYPNPAKDYCIIELNNPLKQSDNTSVSIYNTLGEKLFEAKNVTLLNDRKIRLELDGLNLPQTTLLYVVVSSGEQRYTLPLMIVDNY